MLTATGYLAPEITLYTRRYKVVSKRFYFSGKTILGEYLPAGEYPVASRLDDDRAVAIRGAKVKKIFKTNALQIKEK